MKSKFFSTRSKIVFALTVIASFAFVAYDAQSQSRSEISIAAKAVTPAPLMPVAEAPIQHASPLFGEWSLCKAGSGRFFGMLNEPIRSQLTTYSFDDANVQVKISSFVTKDCSGSALFDYTARGSYEVGAMNKSVKDATNITHDFSERAQIIVHDEETAKFFTFQQLCKVSKWTIGEAVSSNAACDAKFFNQLALSDVFQVKDGELYFGNSGHSKAGEKLAPKGLIVNYAYAN